MPTRALDSIAVARGATQLPPYLMMSWCLPGSCGFTFRLNVPSWWSYSSEKAVLCGPTQCADSSPGPARRVSMNDLISWPTTPLRRPSPLQTTRLASARASTVTFSGQPLICLRSGAGRPGQTASRAPTRTRRYSGRIQHRIPCGGNGASSEAYGTASRRHYMNCEHNKLS